MEEMKKVIKTNGSFGFEVGNDAASMSLEVSKQRPSSPGRVSGSCLATNDLSHWPSNLPDKREAEISLP